MAKGLIDVILDRIFNNNWKGRRGEKLTEREFNLVKLLGNKGKVLRNLYIPKDNGEFSEIDLVFITPKGIFVIESKNYSGWIFGEEASMYWTAMLPNKVKNTFYNPIKQNATHIKWLGQYLNEDIPLFSIIVFSERCELKKIVVDSPEIQVIKRNELYATVRSVWNMLEDSLSEEKLNAVYLVLKSLTKVDRNSKKAHIENIKAKYSETPKNNIEKVPEQEKSLICPSCGGNLVLRKAKKGINAGSEFYGCSNYPKCRYIINIKVDSLETVEKVTPKVLDSEKSLVCPSCGGEIVLRKAKTGTSAGSEFYGCSNYPKCRYTQNIDE